MADGRTRLTQAMLAGGGQPDLSSQAVQSILASLDGGAAPDDAMLDAALASMTGGRLPAPRQESVPVSGPDYGQPRMAPIAALPREGLDAPGGTEFIEGLSRPPGPPHLGTRTMDEAADIREGGEYLRGAASLGTAAPAGRVASMTARVLANLAARAPRAAAGATALGTTAAGTGQAEPPDALSTARDTIGRLRGSQARLEAERTRLGAERIQFDKINSSDKDAVKDAQRRVGVTVDGIWSGKTSAAIAAHKLNVERQIEALDKQAARLGQDLEGQQQRLTGLEGGERLREAEQNVDPFSSALRKYGEIGGTAAGVALGVGARVGAVRHANRSAMESAREIADMLRNRTTAVAPRSGRLAEVWRRGGQGANPPFVSAPGTPHGVAANPNAAATGQLFPGRPGIRGQVTGTDAAIMGGLGLEGGVAESRRWAAEHEVGEAQAAAQRDPSAVNIARLQRATNDAAFWQALGRVGQAGALSYGVTSTKTPRVYPRPDLSRADAEVANLNRLIAPPPKPAPRRAGRGETARQSVESATRELRQQQAAAQPRVRGRFAKPEDLDNP